MTNVSVMVGFLFGLAVLIPFIYSAVHYALEECFYFPLALAYCRKYGLTPIKWRCNPALHDGFKTEFTIVEVLCSDDNDIKSVVRLLVWVFGIKKVLDRNALLAENDHEPLQR